MLNHLMSAEQPARIPEPRQSGENIDLTDTSRCPLLAACELCGARAGVKVIAVEAPYIGVGCVSAAQRVGPVGG